MKHVIILLLSAVLFYGCQEKEPQKSTDFVFVGEFSAGLEGPAVDKSGDLFFVNPKKNGTIGKAGAMDANFEILIDSLPNGSVANGIRFGENGDMYLADYVNHQILVVKEGANDITVFASDTLMNQPNDIAMMQNGVLLASDPNWANETGNVWSIDTDGSAHLLESDMGTTNGIEVAPGDTILYVNESVQRKIWAYDLNEEGHISNKRLLIAFEDFGLDGMRCDVEGNIYVARYGKGTVAVISPAGKLLYEINLISTKPTNVAFGGADGKTVYVTCQDRGYIEMFKAQFVGRSFTLH